MIGIMSWCLSKNINKKFETIQYSLNIKLDQPEGIDDDDDDINENMKGQLLQIKAYRGCKKQLRRQIAAELGIPRSKLEIAYIGITKNGCYIQIVHIIIDSLYEKEKMYSSIYSLYEDHGDLIENIIKKLYNLKWDIEIQVAFTPNDQYYDNGQLQLGNRIVSDDDYQESQQQQQQQLPMSSSHQLLECLDDSSSDTL